MKKTLITLALVAMPAIGLLVAQEYKSRVTTPTEERKLAGTTSWVQDEYFRTKSARWATGLYYAATNYYDGIVLVRSNATVLVHIGLPNPTNNPYRVFEISTLDACTATLSNANGAGSFTDMFTLTNASVYFIASNKTATAYSTGSNCIVRLY